MRRVGAEVDHVRVERGRVAVVVVDDRQGQLPLQGGADVEPIPLREREVGRALRGEHPVGAGRARSVQADRADRAPVGAGQLQHHVDRAGERVERGGRAFQHAARRLHEPVHQKSAGLVHHRGVRGRAADVEADDDTVS
ncbi:hypothetical protein Pflav_008610 [Phytohabitans flavus]|uniref:Uncharacterized protein n=1 Tax=Phytohabitans flavus TaxID=1076124 RepID=A0A6F8XKY4_9ACTN|nr:hypothetical protein Pflav_008610 [Phytohabitans flavus]